MNAPSKKICELIGIAFIAKKLFWGDFACASNIYLAKLIIISTDCGGAICKKFSFLAQKFNLPLIRFATKVELAQCIGKQIVSVIVITDEKLSAKIKKYMEV